MKRASKMFISNALATISKYLVFVDSAVPPNRLLMRLLTQSNSIFFKSCTILSSYGELRLFITTFKVLAMIAQVRLLLRELKSGIQLVTLSETWLKRDVGDGEFKIPGYRLCRKDRDAKNGGVAIYSYFEKGCRKKMCTRQCRKVLWDMINTK